RGAGLAAARAALAEGRYVAVRVAGGPRLQGHVLAPRADALALLGTWRGETHAIPAGRVATVEVRGRGNVGAGATLGALLGAGFGVVVVGTAGAAGQRNEIGPALVVAATINGLLGAAIGYAVTRERWRQLWPPASPR
ncbi:hypothetical protein PYV61_06985, partial [Roseisolibacter sp. H3M3-2]